MTEKVEKNETLIANYVKQLVNAAFNKLSDKFVIDLNTILDSNRAEAQRLQEQISKEVLRYSNSLLQQPKTTSEGQ